jgi:hypothetical protein
VFGIASKTAGGTPAVSKCIGTFAVRSTSASGSLLPQKAFSFKEKHLTIGLK